MNEVEFYSKAQSDVSFRQQQMDEATYLEKLNKTGFGLGVIAMAAYATYCGIAQHRLVDFSSLGLLAALSSLGYTQARTRLAILRAINAASSATKPRLQ